MAKHPLVQVIFVDPIPLPIMVSDLATVIPLAHDWVPAGTVMVAPVAAAVTQSLTSVLLALAAVRERPDPPQTASPHDTQARQRRQEQSNRFMVYLTERTGVPTGGDEPPATAVCSAEYTPSYPLASYAATATYHVPSVGTVTDPVTVGAAMLALTCV
jgi:hypothetical protein